MVVEILSPSTQRHDRLTKFNLYQRAGVRGILDCGPRKTGLCSPLSWKMDDIL